MNRFVLDCSVTMGWCFEDQANAMTDRVLESLQEQEALVPSLWVFEVANVLLVAERRKRLKKAESLHFSELLSALPIHIDQTNPQNLQTSILSLGRDHGLSAYDACYLELACRQGLPLATRDTALKKAAKKSGAKLL
jgi:predicted nucleic acid-binding protein